MQTVFSAEASGRVLKYSPTTKETIVLMRNLQFPNGVSLSKDGSFFVFSEGAVGRLGITLIDAIENRPISVTASCFDSYFHVRNCVMSFL